MSHHQSNPNNNVTLTIDGQRVTVPEGTRILEAAKKASVKIPTLCEHPDLCKRAVCRVCVVEADGRGKLLAACANDVWEGVNIVTNNARLLSIRKTILELILANHPQDCLNCARNTNCELQSLAEQFGINSTSFRNDELSRESAAPESGALVRDMAKCVKCGRCVEMCQEVQTIRAINTSHRSGKYEISIPYKQSHEESSCVFCGQCVSVCPVGALCGYDQSTELLSLLNDSGSHAIAQLTPDFIPSLNTVLKKYRQAKADKVITAGQIVTALKLIGFEKVYDSGIAANIIDNEQSNEFHSHAIKSPVIYCSTSGVNRFIKNFYPDLIGHLSAVKNIRQVFADTIKAAYVKQSGLPELSADKVISVTCASGISLKYDNNAPLKNDFALNADELTRMVNISGIEIADLEESTFDAIDIELDNSNRAVNKKTVYGFAEARKVMEEIRRGECKADFVVIGVNG